MKTDPKVYINHKFVSKNLKYSFWYFCINNKIRDKAIVINIIIL